MFSLRCVSRIATTFRLINSKSVFHHVQNQENFGKALPVILFQSSRNYAKGKDKRSKDNGRGKRMTKVEVNEEQLGQVVNLEKLKSQMEKSLETMKDEFVKNLSLRSSTGAIETLKVNADGKEYELQEIGQIIRKNPKTIVINLLGFPQLIPQVLASLNKSGMNLNPQQDGTTIFVPVPKITKEHRENLAKNAKALFIKCRDGVKDTQNSHLKKLKGNKEISIDLNHQIQDQVISIADGYIAEADKLLQTKQSELLASKD